MVEFSDLLLVYLAIFGHSGLAETSLSAVNWISGWSTCSATFPKISGTSMSRFANVDNCCSVATWRNLVCSLLLRRWLLFHRSSPESVFTRTDYLSYVPPTYEYGTRPFLRWFRSQDRSPHTSGKAKITFGPVGILLIRGAPGARQ